MGGRAGGTAQRGCVLESVTIRQHIKAAQPTSSGLPAQCGGVAEKRATTTVKRVATRGRLQKWCMVTEG